MGNNLSYEHQQVAQKAPECCQSRTQCVQGFQQIPHRQQRLDDKLKNLCKELSPELSSLGMQTSPVKTKERVRISQSDPETPNLANDINKDNVLIGKQYFEDSHTLIGSNRFIQSQIHSEYLKDLSQSNSSLNLEFSPNKFNKIADTNSVRMYNLAIAQNKLDIQEEESEDDYYLEDAVIEDQVKLRLLNNLKSYDEYVNFDWSSIKFSNLTNKFSPRKKDNQTIYNIINQIGDKQMSLRSMYSCLKFTPKIEIIKKGKNVL